MSPNRDYPTASRESQTGSSPRRGLPVRFSVSAAGRPADWLALGWFALRADVFAAPSRGSFAPAAPGPGPPPRRLRSSTPRAWPPLFTPEIQWWGERLSAGRAQFGLDPNLAATVMQIESCGDPRALSSAGAMGLFQVMPFHFFPPTTPSTPIPTPPAGWRISGAHWTQPVATRTWHWRAITGDRRHPPRPVHLGRRNAALSILGERNLSRRAGRVYPSARLDEWRARAAGCAAARQRLGVPSNQPILLWLSDGRPRQIGVGELFPFCSSAQMPYPLRIGLLTRHITEGHARDNHQRSMGHRSSTLNVEPCPSAEGLQFFPHAFRRSNWLSIAPGHIRRSWAGAGSLAAVEPVEDVVEVLAAGCPGRCLDVDPHPLRLHAQANGHSTVLGGVLDGVGDQVDEHLLETVAVAIHLAWSISVSFNCTRSAARTRIS